MRDKMEMSRAEQRILTLLPLNGTRIDTGTLTRQFYRGRTPPPHARIAVGNLLRALVRKTKRQQLRVFRTRRAGPYPTEYWLERRV